MITAQAEKLNLQELKPFLEGHWKELALNKDKVPLNPCYSIYLDREAVGELMYITLREGGKLIGYFVGFVAPGMHYKTCLTLTMDIIYVIPGRRGNGGGLILTDHIEKEARRRGVKRWFMGFKVEHAEHMEALLQHIGMTKVEVFYSKWIGD